MAFEEVEVVEVVSTNKTGVSAGLSKIKGEGFKLVGDVADLYVTPPSFVEPLRVVANG